MSSRGNYKQMRPITYEIPQDMFDFIVHHKKALLAEDWKQKFTEGYLEGLRQFNDEVNTIKVFNPENEEIIKKLLNIKEESRINSESEVFRAHSSLGSKINMAKYGYHLAFYNGSKKLLLMYDKIKVSTDKSNKSKKKDKIIKPTTFSSFMWRGKPEQLVCFYNELVKHLLIDDQQTSLDSFIAIFNNKFEGPIYWKSSNKLLGYLLEEMQNPDRLKNPFIIEKNYQSVIGKNGLFIKKEGNPFKPNDLSQAKRKNNDEGLPEGCEIINSIIETVSKN